MVKTLVAGQVGGIFLYHADGSPCCSVGYLNTYCPFEDGEKWRKAYRAYAESLGEGIGRAYIPISELNDLYLNAEQRATACNVAFAYIGLNDDPEVLDILRSLNLGSF